MPGHPRRSETERMLLWSGVFVLNCFLPAFIVLGGTASGGRAGVVTGVLVIWVAGTATAYRSARLGDALSLGGVAVAVMQFFCPVLQLAAGVAALTTWEWVSGEGVRGLSEFGGFAVTLMTAQPLILVALVLGYWFTTDDEEPAGEPVEDD